MTSPETPTPRAFLLSLALLSGLVGCATARMQLPAAMSAVEPWPVTGANPRTWNRPLAFGPWRTTSVRERSTVGWGFEALGITTTSTRRPYALTLEGADGEVRDVACLTRDITLSRGSLAADLTGLAAPRLVCAIHGEAEMPATLVLGRHRSGLRGTLRTSMGTHPVESVHRLEGSRISNADPVGYSIGGEESTVAAVEVVNRGYVWIAPAAGHDRAALAAAAAALLLFEPDIGPD